MPVHPLIAQAIEDALAPFGCARIERVPVTRADIHAMVRAARASLPLLPPGETRNPPPPLPSGERAG
jgi:hypothetical protein